MKAAKVSWSVSARWWGLVLAALVGMAPAAEAAITMRPAVNYPVGRAAAEVDVRNVAIGDFDGDGKLDMAVPNSASETVSILLGADGGAFASAGILTIDDGTWDTGSPRTVVAADFNRDGRLDLAVTDAVTERLVIIPGNGDGTFGQPGGMTSGLTVPISLVAGDFDRNGTQDLVVASYASAKVSVFLGTGDGLFDGPWDYAAGDNPLSLAAGDLDGDGDLDLAVANKNDLGAVSILTNDGTGVFGAPAVLAAGTGTRAVIANDLNRDGRLDLVAVNEVSADVSIFLGSGGGGFLAAESYPAGSVPCAVAAGDLDGDGIPELAVTDGSDNAVTVLAGVGDGSFRAVATFPTGRRPAGVGIADFDGDGKPDLVTANRDADGEAFGVWNVSVLLNSTSFGPTGVLVPKDDQPVGAGPNSLVAGDFNRDGIPDLVSVNSFAETVSYLQGLGYGGFASSVNSAAGAYPFWVTAGDFDGDGDLDLAVANATLAGTVSILLGDGGGTFAAPVNYTAGAYPVSVASGDFNRDGRLDLVVANAGSDAVSILLGLTAGAFLPGVSYGVGAAPYSIAVGDFDRDGKPDVAAANFYSSSVSILLGNGDGTLGWPVDHYLGYNPVSVTSADLDGDGALDLATANYWSSDVSVLRGVGDGSFLAAVDYPVGANPAGLAVGDFFRDGKPDLAAASEGAGRVQLLAARGDGTFSPPVSFAAGAQPVAVVGVDLNRDGKADVASANWGADSVSVFLNWNDTVSAPATPAAVDLLGESHDRGVAGRSYGFSTGGAAGSMGHPVEYQFDWLGNGADLSDWGPPLRSHGWSQEGARSVRARARCASHPEVVSGWSAPLFVDIDAMAIWNLQVEGGALSTKKTTADITFGVATDGLQYRTSIGGPWSAWRTYYSGDARTASLGATNGLVHVYVQAKDAHGRITETIADTIYLDTKAPTGVVKLNGGNPTVQDSGAPGALVRVQLAMFDASMNGAQVRLKRYATFSGDPDPDAPWESFDAGSTGRDLFLEGLGVKKVFVQFKDGAGLTSVVYAPSITVSATGIPWPLPTVVTVTNARINAGKPYATSPTVKLTYDVNQETGIKARYLYGAAWTAWETPVVNAGTVTKTITLTTLNGPRQVYVQVKEVAPSFNPEAMTDPVAAFVTLDTAPPGGMLQINNGTTTLRRFNTAVNYVVLTILGTDGASGIDKIAISQTGSPVTVPPPASSPDWRDFSPTVNSFGLNTRTTGVKSVYVWLKDRAGKVSARKVASVNVIP